jgi:hypothetical protein
VSSQAFDPAAWPYYFAIDSDPLLVDEAVGTLMFDLSNAPASFWSLVKSDGGDVRVTNSAGTTAYSAELVSFSTSTQKGLLFFDSSSVLSISVTSTWRVYFGNASASAPSASDTLGRNNVWSGAGYARVWHLVEDPTGSSPQFVDSTGNTSGGTAQGTIASGARVAGPFSSGYSLDLDGASDYLDLGSVDTPTASSAASTIGFWGKRSSAGGSNPSRLIVGCGDTTSFRRWEGILWDDGSGYVVCENGSEQASAFTDSGTSWKHCLFTFDGSLSGTSRIKVYRDGASQTLNHFLGTPPATLASAANLTNFIVGRDNNGGRYGGGAYAEVRLSTVARTANYASTHYNNQSNQAGFWDVGSVQGLSSDTLRPSGDDAIGDWTDNAGGTSAIYAKIDDDPDSPTTGSDRIQYVNFTGVQQTKHAVFDLTPSPEGTTVAATVKVYAGGVDSGGGTDWTLKAAILDANDAVIGENTTGATVTAGASALFTLPLTLNAGTFDTSGLKLRLTAVINADIGAYVYAAEVDPYEYTTGPDFSRPLIGRGLTTSPLTLSRLAL